MVQYPPEQGNITKNNVENTAGTNIWTHDQYFKVPSCTELKISLPSFRIRTTGEHTVTRPTPIRVSDGAQLHIRIQVVDRDDESIDYSNGGILFGLTSSNLIFPDLTNIPGTYLWYSISDPVKLHNELIAQNRTTSTVNMRIKMTVMWGNVVDTPLEYGTGNPWVFAMSLFTDDTTPGYAVAATDIIRSYSHFDYNDLWNNDYNPFDFILNYCRMFRIGIYTDNINKKLIFKPIHKYLNEGDNQADWTNIVDWSRDFIVKPISWDTQYVKFNYEENELVSNEHYLKDFGYNYGEKRIQTNYKFNNETNNLFENIGDTISYTPYVNSWINLFYNNKIIYLLPNEHYFENIDEDNKQQNVFGYFGFSDETVLFDYSSNLRHCILTDDSNLEIYNTTYCYNQSDAATSSIDSYRTIDDRYIIGSQTFWSKFSVPSKIYDIRSITTTNYDIYTLFWKRFIDERYNKNNKVVTCYVNITPEEYQNFKFNKFVNIDNQLYFVNRIFDFNLTSNEPTKVELITIQDPAAYRTNLYDEIL